MTSTIPVPVQPDFWWQWLCQRMTHIPGGTRLALMATQALYRHGWRRAPVGRSPDGFSFFVQPGSHVDWPLFLYNTYEREVHDCIQKMLQPEAVFCDVGANVGCFTLLAAPLVGERGLVLGFEPQPDAFRRLQANLGLNHFDNVRLFPLALGAKEGEIGLYDGGANWTHCASVYPSKWHEHCSRIPVRMAALDALLEQAQIRRVDLIKIDVEGAELDVLTGATQCLRRCKPKLIIEINPTTMTAGGWRWGNLRDFLSPFGYRLCRLLDGGRIETLAPDLNIEVFTLVAV